MDKTLIRANKLAIKNNGVKNRCQSKNKPVKPEYAIKLAPFYADGLRFMSKGMDRSQQNIFESIFSPCIQISAGLGEKFGMWVFQSGNTVTLQFYSPNPSLISGRNQLPESRAMSQLCKDIEEKLVAS